MNQNLLGVCNSSQPHMYQSSKLHQPVICEVVRTIIFVVVVIIPCWSLLLRLRGPLQNIRSKTILYDVSEIIECASCPCNNGGYCLEDIGYYECVCKEGYNGTECDTGSPHCFIFFM